MLSAKLLLLALAVLHSNTALLLFLYWPSLSPWSKMSISCIRTKTVECVVDVNNTLCSIWKNFNLKIIRYLMLLIFKVRGARRLSPPAADVDNGAKVWIRFEHLTSEKQKLIWKLAPLADAKFQIFSTSQSHEYQEY